MASVQAFVATALVAAAASSAIAQDFCSVARALDQAAPSQFNRVLGEMTAESASTDEYREYTLRNEHLLPGVRRRSDCVVGVLGSDAAGEGKIECKFTLRGMDAKQLASESRKLAEALVACLSPETSALGSSIHRINTRHARWSVLVPHASEWVALEIAPLR